MCNNDEERPHREAKGMTITSLPSILNFHTFRIKGGVQGQQFVILIDSGAIHNFIDSGLVRKLGLPTINIGYFTVLVTGRHNMACTQHVQHLELSMGNHTVTNPFFVLDLKDTDIILGV
jgi:predicted aspartyl protease